MKQYKYTGLFISSKGNEFKLEVYTSSFFNAFFLLTAKAIEQGKHYQLSTITSEVRVMQVGDIMKVSELIF